MNSQRKSSENCLRPKSGVWCAVIIHCGFTNLMPNQPEPQLHIKEKSTLQREHFVRNILPLKHFHGTNYYVKSLPCEYSPSMCANRVNPQTAWKHLLNTISIARLSEIQWHTF